MQIAEPIREKEEQESVWSEEGGYFTIEAAFFIPFVFLLLCLVMISGLYLWDLNQAKSFLNGRITELSGVETEYESSSLKADMTRLQEKLFVTSISHFVIAKSGDKVKGEVEVRMRISVPMVGDWIGNIWGSRFAFIAEEGNDAERMRRWSQLE